MIEHAIASFEDFHKIVTRQQADWWCWYYRGHSRMSYELVPKAGREPYRSRAMGDRRMFDTWKLHGVAFLSSSPREFTDWDMLAIAQHYGLATRLLDWTFNPLTAAFFAVVSSDGTIDEESDAAVYAHWSSRPFVDVTQNGPFDYEGIHRLAPSSVTPRIGRQGGIFTLHGPPSLRLDDHLPDGDRLERLVIKRTCRRQFAIQLSHYGVNRMSLFPDLDGLSAHINWSFTHLPYSPLQATRAFYELDARRYANETQAYSLVPLWDSFSSLLPTAGHILDLGCGAGRDLKEFSCRGFRVLGVDYSSPLASIAEEFSQQEVRVCSFEEMDFAPACFDGIWAVASLLHVPRDAISPLLAKLHSLLRTDGVLLTSMQQGKQREFSDDGRMFELYEPLEWESLLDAAGFSVLQRQETVSRVGNRGTGQREIKWFVTICRKRETSSA